MGTIAVVGVLALAGCTHDGAKSDSSSATTAVAASTPTPTLPAPVPSPARPDLWSNNDYAGASAAGVWFAGDLYTYVMETNDATDWTALSDPACVFCQNVAKDAQTAIDEGTVLRMGRYQIVATRVEELNPLSYSVLVDVVQHESQVLDLAGNVVDTQQAADGQMLLVLDRVGTDWHLAAGEWFDKDVDVPSSIHTS